MCLSRVATRVDYDLISRKETSRRIDWPRYDTEYIALIIGIECIISGLRVHYEVDRYQFAYRFYVLNDKRVQSRVKRVHLQSRGTWIFNWSHCEDTLCIFRWLYMRRCVSHFLPISRFLLTSKPSLVEFSPERDNNISSSSILAICGGISSDLVAILIRAHWVKRFDYWGGKGSGTDC